MRGKRPAARFGQRAVLAAVACVPISSEKVVLFFVCSPSGEKVTCQTAVKVSKQGPTLVSGPHPRLQEEGEPGDPAQGSVLRSGSPRGGRAARPLHLGRGLAVGRGLGC